MWKTLAAIGKGAVSVFRASWPHIVGRILVALAAAAVSYGLKRKVESQLAAGEIDERQARWIKLLGQTGIWVASAVGGHAVQQAIWKWKGRAFVTALLS